MARPSTRKFACLACIAPVAATLALSSCTQTLGNKAIMEDAKYQNLVPGRSSKPDVYAQFGQPSKVEYSPGNISTWTYNYRYAKSDFWGYIPVYGIGLFCGGKNGDVYTRTFLFTPDQKLQGVVRQSRKMYSNNFATLGRSISSPFTDNPDEPAVKQEMGFMERKFDSDAASDAKHLQRLMED